MDTLMLTQKIRLFAPVVLRYSMTGVFLWFGVIQLIDPSGFVAYVPDSVVGMTGMSGETLVICNAWFEIVFGGMLLFGFWIRLSAVLLSLHLFNIAFIVGYGETGVRDLGLAFATLVVGMNGADELSLDK
jgi:uncharacterized membrane protein YphA (DoxX/SURF4 family)